jgi:ComF family protein
MLMEDRRVALEHDKLSSDSRVSVRSAAWRVFAPLLATATRVVFPARCVFCGAAGLGDPCEGCRNDVPGRTLARCPVCAIDVPDGRACGQCLSVPPAFAHVAAAGSYAFPLDAAIVKLKYACDLRLVAPLAELLIEMARREPPPDVLVPMPLGAARLRERGFNQSAEIARQLARRLALPLGSDAATRIRDGVPQASLPLDQRARNVRGAFAVPNRLDGLRVTVVDDVMTTGATLHELAATLRRAGALEVSAWVLARTPKP